MLKFRVEFKGKKFPEDLRRTLGFVAPDESRAKEWVAKQIDAWHLPANTQFELSLAKGARQEAMSIYDFLVQNQSMMEQIEFAADGAIEVPPSEFGFAHPDLQMEVVKHQMVFEIDIGQFKVRTKVWIENFSDAADYLKLIKDVEKRQEVIELIENNYRSEAELQLEVEESNLEEVTSRRDQAKEDFDLVVDTLREIKSAWKIP